jgi:hypothetical protein
MKWWKRKENEGEGMFLFFMFLVLKSLCFDCSVQHKLEVFLLYFHFSSKREICKLNLVSLILFVNIVDMFLS